MGKPGVEWTILAMYKYHPDDSSGKHGVAKGLGCLSHHWPAAMSEAWIGR
jgi:hypothetical protein